MSFIYEMAQLFFKFGSFDTNDPILNTFGGTIGYLLIMIGLLLFKRNIIKNHILNLKK
ncbi:VanZ family protein [Fictibacillus sp. WQ 8-8]|uniref:VanZ family protein n=1 Tax=Fictibacillus sp. WQ 8-8 TaxID=2938788 RepID=UPI00210CE33F|nr:VanZ family protein [Fictibacillus sp. WQ 8-8]